MKTHRLFKAVAAMLVLHTEQTTQQATDNHGVTFLYPTAGLTMYYMDNITVVYESNFSAPRLYTFCGNSVQKRNDLVAPYNASVLVALNFPVQSDTQCWFDLRPNTTAGYGANSVKFYFQAIERSPTMTTTATTTAATSSTSATDPASTTSASTTPTPTPSDTSAASPAGGLSTGASAGLGAGVGVVGVAVGAAVAVFFLRRRKRKDSAAEDNREPYPIIPTPENSGGSYSPSYNPTGASHGWTPGSEKAALPNNYSHGFETRNVPQEMDSAPGLYELPTQR